MNQIKEKITIFIKFTAIILLSFFAAAKVCAQVNKELPTRITSNIIDIKRKSQIIEFLGNVVAKKGTDSLLADRMRVFYEENDENAPKTDQNKANSIKKIEAYDNVKIITVDFVATGKKGYYDPISEFFVLEEKVVVNNKTSIANGEKFIYNLKTKKGNFVGESASSTPANNNNKKDKRVIVIIGDDLKADKNKKKKDLQKNEQKSKS